MLPYRASRWFLVWLAADVSVTLVLMASAGPAYLQWRAQYPWLLPLTLAPFLLLTLHNRRRHR